MSDDATVPRDVPARGNQRDGVPTQAPEVTARTEPAGLRDVVFRAEGLDFHYGRFKALEGVTLDIRRNEITALIGPSGCGKTTFLRCLNRMNDLIPGTRVDGTPLRRTGPVRVRRRPGRAPAHRHGLPEAQPLPEVRQGQHRLRPQGQRPQGERRQDRGGPAPGRAVGRGQGQAQAGRLRALGGQQQRLCIARAIAVEPEVVLMDEPCSALDPISTLAIEDLMQDLVQRYTIVIVTHNMQQAARVSHKTGFFTVAGLDKGQRYGVLVETGETEHLFTAPSDQRTQDYITGRFG